MSKPLCLTGSVNLTAKKTGPPKVSILAYTGNVMVVGGWGRVVVDLAGLSVPSQVPILSDHDASLQGVVGNAVPSIVRGQVLASGTLSDVPGAKQLATLAKDGLAWQSSVGLEVEDSRYVKAGETVSVNGRTIKEAQPFTLILKATLKEITICALGADAETSVSIAAARAGRKAFPMNFEQWLQAQGWDASTLSDTQKATLKAAYDSEFGGGGTATTTAAADLRAEASRLAAIRSVCRDHADIEARAIDEGWSRDQTELAVLRASRVTPPRTSFGTRRADVTGNVLECALMQHLGAHDVAGRTYDANTLQAAHDLHVRHFMDLAEHSLRAHHIEPHGSGVEVLRAGWSTNAISGILSNTANKILMDQYQAFPSVAKLVAKKLSANDFKTHTGYRLTAGTTMMAEVGNGGEIQHGNLAEASHTFKIATYARMFSITRQDQINDDLGALNEIPRIIGLGAAAKLEDIFWTLALANTGSFFAEANGNYLTTALGEPGLTAAVTLLRKLKDAEGKPISVVPKTLVVPPELETTADGLYASKNIAITGDTDTSRPDSNVFAGKYQPAVVPHLSNENYTNYSTTAWYLFSDPAITPAFGIAFLNGIEQPTIENSESDFHTLGMQFRGYHDFGVCQIDSNGAVFSTGAG